MLKPSIFIWKDCDPAVSDAIGALHDRWRPSSGEKHTIRLIEEIIDPALVGFFTTLAPELIQYVPGAAAGRTVSEVIKLIGLKESGKAQRKLLRAFVITRQKNLPDKDRFVATLESVIELMEAAARKRETKAVLRGFDANRLRDFCRFCGEMPELTSFVHGDDGIRDDDPDEELNLSTRYCQRHRPKFKFGHWNNDYRTAKRSVMQFDLELKRLTTNIAIGALLGRHPNLEQLVIDINHRACNKKGAKVGTGSAMWGDDLVDRYIHHYVSAHDLVLADEAAVREHARRIVDAKLTDRKKQMVILQRYGANQSDIARQLGIHRQVVSKELAAIPIEFRRLPMMAIAPNITPA